MSPLVFTMLVGALACLGLSFAAWRATTEGGRRADARIAALAEAIAEGVHGPDAVARPVAVSHLFAAGSTEANPRRYGVAAFAVIGVAAVASTLVALSVHRPLGTSHAPARPSAAATLPIELTALGHERDGATLTVHGVVRNPPAAPTVDHVSVVVTAYAGDGRLLGTGERPLDSDTLAGGSESRFAVPVEHADGADRYRVSFRRGGRILPHVDRRTQGNRTT